MILLHRLDISKASGYAVSTKTQLCSQNDTWSNECGVLYQKQGLLQLISLGSYCIWWGTLEELAFLEQLYSQVVTSKDML
jgi:hypothetical protein